MNAITSFRKCTLSDKELLEKVDNLTDEMYKTGKIPDRQIPARPDKDYDLLVGELILRFNETLSPINNVVDEKKSAEYEMTEEEFIAELERPLEEDTETLLKHDICSIMYLKIKGKNIDSSSLDTATDLIYDLFKNLSAPKLNVDELQKEISDLKEKIKQQTEVICGQVMEIDSLLELNRKIGESQSAQKVNVEEAAEATLIDKILERHISVERKQSNINSRNYYDSRTIDPHSAKVAMKELLKEWQSLQQSSKL